MTYEEIAEQLGITEGGVRAIEERAIKKLRKLVVGTPLEDAYFELITEKYPPPTDERIHNMIDEAILREEGYWT